MKGWKECKLSDAVKFGNGKVRPNSDGTIPVYGGNGILGFGNESNYKDETIVIGRVGAYCGAVYFENKPIWVSDNALSAKPTDISDAKFIFYYLKNLGLNQFAEGSSHPLVTQTLLNSIDIIIPSTLPEQRAIASVLSSLDDKIYLLHRQNKTLEAMAETLFRQWFVEEADEGWEEGKLSQYVDIGIGRTPPRQEHEWFSESETDIKWISIKDLGNDGTYIFKTAEYLTRNAVERFNIPVIPSNTVVLSFKMTVGRVAITTEEMLSNEAIAHFKFKCDTPFSVEYLYFYLKTYQYDSLGSTSSIVTAINSAMIKDLTINLPDENKMTKFSIVVQNIFEKVKTNKIQIRTLEKLRDTLLPKLMSGEVRVDYKKEAAGEY